ncbi:MAG: hypothetical protein ACPLZ9_03880, partial [Candidatus Ratteibacteria bacterium]
MKRIFIFLFLFWKFLSCDIVLDLKNSEKLEDGSLKYKLNLEKEGTYFLKFEGTVPDNIHNEGIGYLIKVNGKKVLHKEGWDEGYIPTVIPLEKKNKSFVFLYTVPLNFKKGENEIIFILPEKGIVSSLKLIDSIEGNIKKEVKQAGTNYIFFKNEKPSFSFSLTSDREREIEYDIISYFSILADDKGESSWSPMNRFIAKEIIFKKNGKAEIG